MAGRRRDDRLRTLISLIGFVLLIAAAVRELRMPADERSWHGTIAGVPYDLRPPSLARERAAWWNPDDPRLFTPRGFGVGWAVNLARVRSLVTRS